MSSWKKKVGFWNRLKLAWHAFWLKPYSKQFPIGVRCDDLVQSYIPCDIGGIGRDRGCTDDANHCMSRPTVFIGVELEEHVHVCDYHAYDDRWMQNSPEQPILKTRKEVEEL